MDVKPPPYGSEGDSIQGAGWPTLVRVLCGQGRTTLTATGIAVAARTVSETTISSGINGFEPKRQGAANVDLRHCRTEHSGRPEDDGSVVQRGGQL